MSRCIVAHAAASRLVAVCIVFKLEYMEMDEIVQTACDLCRCAAALHLHATFPRKWRVQESRLQPQGIVKPQRQSERLHAMCEDCLESWRRLLEEMFEFPFKKKKREKK